MKRRELEAEIKAEVRAGVMAERCQGSQALPF